MVNTDVSPGGAGHVRDLARLGLLKEAWSTASADRRRELRAGAGEIVWPLVFNRTTKRLEYSRGHFQCATAIEKLEPACFDKLHDDVEAVLDDLFANAGVPIENLEGWLVTFMRRATVDGHRKRRAARGAAQRPRLTVWQRRALEDDPWLLALALDMIEWVGVEATAGAGEWPTAAWAERRALALHADRPDEAAVMADVEQVQAAMRQRRGWYQSNIEDPLGRKQAPVWLARPAADGVTPEPEPLVFVSLDELNDLLMTELAAEALDTMRTRIRAGEAPEFVVPEVIEAVFGAPPVGHGLDRVPGSEPAGPELAVTLVRDPIRRRRIVAAVVAMLKEEM